MSELPSMTYQESKLLGEVLMKEAISKGTYIFTAVQKKRPDDKISKETVARSFAVISNLLATSRPSDIVYLKETKNGGRGIPPKSVVSRSGEDGKAPGPNGPRKVR